MSRILIVDDVETNREVLLALLGPLGYETAEAADGVEALARVREFSPDLVLCDILMPTMDGFTFVSALRADPETAGTKVVFHTAHYHEREARNLALACGVTEVLTKPVEPELVLEAIGRMLGTPVPAGEAVRAAAFERDHLRLVTDKLSEQAGALEAAQERLSALIELNLRLVSEKDAQALLASVCQGARRLIGARFAAIEVRAKDGAGSPLTSIIGIPDEKARHLAAPRMQGGMLGRATLASETRRFADLNGKSALFGLPADLPPFGSALAAPVLSRSDAYGWLCLFDKVGSTAFSDEEERLLTILAAHVGRIYENGSLYARVQRHAERLEEEVRERERAQRRVTLQYEVARVLAAAESLEQARSDLLRALCEGLGFAFGAMWQVDRRERFLQCAALWQASPETTAAFARNTRSVVFLRGTGLPGQAWSSARPQWVEDVLAMRRFIRRDTARASGLRTAAAFPITSGDRFVGCIELLARGRLAHEPGIEDQLESIGRQLGLFVERTEQRARLARLNRIHAALSGVSALILRSRDRQKLCEGACEVVVKDAKFGVAWIALLDSVSGSLRTVARSAADASPAPAHFEDVGNGLVARALHTHRPAFAEDIAVPSSGTERARAPRSAMALPFVSEGRVTGMLGLVAPEPGFFGEEERSLLGGLAGEISLALEHIAKDEMLRYLALYDPLTGLANRTQLAARVKTALREAKSHGKRVAVVVGDVTHFRFVNETFGRDAGDELLRTIAQRLASVWPDPADLARLTADHFAGVYAEAGDPTQIALFLRERLAPAVEAPFTRDGREIGIAFKAGVAVHPEDGLNAEALIKNAEAALSRAKATGERALFYRPEMTARIAETLLLENRLRRALGKDQFVLHYQPKVDTVTRGVKGVEALLRWVDDEGRMVPPAQFIGLLESSGMILDVGAWVIRRAVRDREAWRSLGLAPPRVAVNVSSIQLQQPDFVRDFLAAADDTGGGEVGIDIEITESLLMRDVEASIAKLAALRERGIGIAIDDFGTGYSSLAYLSRLPVTSLKIDRSFIATLGPSPESRTLVATIVSLAHSMRLPVTAEGVETEEQARLLRTLGCDEIQGYLVSRPQPAEALVALLAGDAAPRPPGKRPEGTP